MIMSTMLINAFHPALEDLKEAFNGVGVDGSIILGNVFALTVPGISMASKVSADIGILPGFIGKDASITRNVRTQDGVQSSGFQVVHNHTARLSGGAINQGKNFVF